MTDPIELVSYRIAYKVKEWDESNTDDVEDLRYGIALQLSYSSALTLAVVISIFTNTILETILSILTIVNLRRFTGGSHMPTLTGCLLLSSTLFSIIPHFELNYDTIIFINMVSLIVVLLFTERRNRVDLIGSLVIIFANGIMCSSTVALSIFAQALSLIKLRG